MRQGFPGYAGAGGPALLAVQVTGIAWFASADRELYALPAQTVVGWPRVVAAFSGGRIPHLVLPEGVAVLPRQALPLAPLPLERVFPLGAAELPWEPDLARVAGAGPVVLGRGWHLLFRERRVFSPWGDGEDLPLLKEFEQRFGPRPRFREVHEKRRIGLKYPQLLEPDRVYRLNLHALSLPDPERYAPVMQVQDRARLVSLDDGVVAVLAAGPLGWTLRVYALASDGSLGALQDEAVAADPAALAERLQGFGRFWRLEPAGAEARLLVQA